MRQKAPKRLLIAILLLFVVMAIAAATIVPDQLRESHARAFANEQCEFMQEKLKEGMPPETVKALTQANITAEHTKNDEFNFTKYEAVIDEYKRTCQVNVTYLHGRTSKAFSSKVLKY